MARKGGMPQMGGNMNNMLKQVQKMQRQMEEAQEKIEQTEMEASSGGGAVRVVVNGKRELVSIEIAKEVVDPDDIEMLQDLVMTAVNEGLKKAEEVSAREMGKVTGGISIPGL